METILDALKAMGKATYREVAARLDIEPVEALNRKSRVYVISSMEPGQSVPQKNRQSSELSRQ
ncbi:hypothetical protein UXP25_15830 [Enterobacter kobei]